MEQANERDPREAGNDPGDSQQIDPQSGATDDPRVDPTPDERQSDTGNSPASPPRSQMRPAQ